MHVLIFESKTFSDFERKCFFIFHQINNLFCFKISGDRYDEEPRGYRDRVANSKMDEIEDWDNGRKSVVSEAIDKAKDLWNRAQGRQYPDDTYG